MTKAMLLGLLLITNITDRVLTSASFVAKRPPLAALAASSASPAPVPLPAPAPDPLLAPVLVSIQQLINPLDEDGIHPYKYERDAKGLMAILDGVAVITGEMVQTADLALQKLIKSTGDQDACFLAQAPHHKISIPYSHLLAIGDGTLRAKRTFITRLSSVNPDKYFCRVFRKSNTTVAFILAELNEECLSITELATLPIYCKQGIAHRLLDAAWQHVKDRTRAARQCSLFINTTPVNVPALIAYKKWTNHPGEYLKEHNAIVFMKEESEDSASHAS